MDDGGEAADGASGSGVEEKRVFDDRAGKTDLLVAADIGVIEVEVSGPRVGRFGVAHRCEPVDLAADAGRVAVATDEDVLVREPGEEAFSPTGFGPAAAVGFDDVAPVAAGQDGRVARLDRGEGGRSWERLGTLDAEVRAIDGRLLAAADGVYRLSGLDYAGLDDARDVAAAGPLVATGDGLYSLGNGWMDELDGAFEVVASGGAVAHAATAEAFYGRFDGEWREVALPTDDAVADVAYGAVPYAVTAEGVLLAEDEDGWRAHALGVSGVVGCAVG